MSEETTESTGGATAEAEKRPVFLTVLCILSFIAAGFAIIGYVTLIGVASAANAITSGMEGMSELEGMEGMEGFSELAAATPSAGMMWANIIVGFICTLAALYGVIQMWKLKKQGFMIYAVASVVAMIMGMIYSFGIVGPIITIAFIVMYYLNLKHMTD